MILEGIDEFISKDLQDLTRSHYNDGSYTQVLKTFVRDENRALKQGILTEKSENSMNSMNRINSKNRNFEIFDEYGNLNERSSLYASELEELFSQNLESSSQSSISSPKLMTEIVSSDKVMASLEAERNEYRRRYSAEKEANTAKDRQIQELKYKLESSKREFSEVIEDLKKDKAQLFEQKEEISRQKNEIFQQNREITHLKEVITRHRQENPLRDDRNPIESIGAKDGQNHVNDRIEQVPLRIYEDQRALLKDLELKNKELVQENFQLQVKNKELELSMAFEQQKMKSRDMELKAFCERLREKLSKYKNLHDESFKLCKCGAVESVMNSWSGNGNKQILSEAVRPPAVSAAYTNFTPSAAPIPGVSAHSPTVSAPPHIASSIPSFATYDASHEPLNQNNQPSEKNRIKREPCPSCSQASRGKGERTNLLRGKLDWEL